MKSKLLPFICGLLISVSSVFAQDITGIATYKSQRKMDIKLDSTQFNDEMQAQMKAMLQKQFEKEYTLKFTRDESLYKEVESLDGPNVMGGNGVQVMVASSSGSDVLYKNVAENRFVNQNELFGKQFLIEDALEEPEWKLEKETKNIGEYTCFRATYTRTVTMRNMVSSSDSDKKDGSSTEETSEEITVTAWYTPQIPVKHGPGQYSGLPGLILEINDGSETILCSRIVLNPNEDLNIKAPTGGKKVDQAEFDEIMDKKMKEMEERYKDDGRKKDGNNFHIEIRG
jgi:GLPGLI family protein